MTTFIQKHKSEDAKFWVTLIVAGVSFLSSVFWLGSSVGKLTSSVEVTKGDIGEIKADIRDMKITIELQKSINTDYDDRIKNLERIQSNGTAIYTEHRSKNGKITLNQVSN